MDAMPKSLWRGPDRAEYLGGNLLYSSFLRKSANGLVLAPHLIT
jgi:hypothetical protein